MQPSALLSPWLQGSGSSHSPRMLPDGVRLSHRCHSGSSLSVHGRDRELPCPLSLWLSYYQIVKVITSRNNSEHLCRAQHPVFQRQCSRTGVLLQANLNFSCLSRTTHGDTGHLSLLSSYSRDALHHCLCFPSISSEFENLKVSTKSFKFQAELQII